MKLKEKLAQEHADPNTHEWHSCNGISLHPIRERSFLAGFEKAREMAAKQAPGWGMLYLGEEEV